MPPRPVVKSAIMSDKSTILKPERKTRTERPRLHKVLLVNDDFTPREFVVAVLKAEFRKGSEQREMIDHVLEATVGAKDLVERMLTFSRQDDPRREPIDSFAVIQKSLVLLKSSIPPTATIRSPARRFF